MQSVGIYAGSFDPIHEGHIAFALEAQKACGLEKVFFLPEPRPRYKQGVKSLRHRKEMVGLAIADYKQFGHIDLDQTRFTVQDTLPVLQARFMGAQLYFLVGDDVLKRMLHWPNIGDLTKQVKFIVGARKTDRQEVEKLAELVHLSGGPKFQYTFVETKYADVSSANIRASIKKQQTPKGLSETTLAYIRKNNLYSSEPSE